MAVLERQTISIARLARAEQGINGDLWARVPDARDSKPQCSILVTRGWWSHLAAKKLGLLYVFRHAVKRVCRRVGEQGGKESGGLPKPGQRQLAWLGRSQCASVTPDHIEMRPQKRNELLENEKKVRKT